MNVVVDSCFWFSLLKNRDSDYHCEAVKIYEMLNEIGVCFIIPYPSLYETINTRLMKEGHREKARWFFTQLMSNANFVIASDDLYRHTAFQNTISEQNDRGISFVDNIIRGMLMDKASQIKALVTFNSKDFADLCYSNEIELINESYAR